MGAEPTKIAIYGAGAIGLDLAYHLISAGHNVTLIARGETLSRLSKDGIQYRDYEDSPNRLKPSSFTVVEQPAQAGTQDYVFLTVKVDALIEVAKNLAPLFHPQTAVISATNGIPPWYSYGQTESILKFLKRSAPRDEFLSYVPAERLLGMVVHRMVSRVDTVSVRHIGGHNYQLGEIDHMITDRVAKLSGLLTQAGLNTDASTDIHRDIWLKLIGNVSVNPVSVLYEKKVGDLIGEPILKNIILRVMKETEAVGIALGVIEVGDFNPDKFFEFAERELRPHMTSMLQDYLRGAQLELHRIVEVVMKFAALKGVEVPVPMLTEVYDKLVKKINS